VEFYGTSLYPEILNTSGLSWHYPLAPLYGYDASEAIPDFSTY
jgi:hypothetical protein